MKDGLDRLIVIERDGDVLANLVERHRNRVGGRIGGQQPARRSLPLTTVIIAVHGATLVGSTDAPSSVHERALPTLELTEHHQSKAAVDQPLLYVVETARTVREPQVDATLDSPRTTAIRSSWRTRKRS